MAKKIFNIVTYLLLLGVLLIAIKHVYAFIIHGNRYGAGKKYVSQNSRISFVVGKKIISKQFCLPPDSAVTALQGERFDKGQWVWLYEHKNQQEYCVLGKFQIIEFSKNGKVFSANARSLLSKLSAYAEISGMRTCLGVITDEKVAEFTEILSCNTWVGVGYRR